MRTARIWIAVAVLVASAALGWALSRPLAPARLHAELELRLSALLEGRVRITSLRVRPGLGLVLEGFGVSVWPSEDGPALRADRVEATLRPFAALTGQPALRSLRIDGAHGTIRRRADGRWSPAPIQRLANAQRDAPIDALSPLDGAEAVVRFLFERIVFTDDFAIRGSEIVYSDERGGRASRLHAQAIHGRLRHHLLGQSSLELRARLRDVGDERGSFEALGERGRDGTLELSVAGTQLHLATLLPLLRDRDAPASVAGELSGVATLSSEARGTGRIALDLVTHAFVSHVPETAPWHLGPRRADRVALRGAVAFAPTALRAEGLAIESDDLALELDGELARPLARRARAELALALRDVSLADVRHLIGWLPEIRREEAQGLVAPLESGNVPLLRAGGAATLGGWQAFLAGRSDVLPENFVLDAQLDGAALRAGPDDRIEALSGRLWWSDDRVVVRDVHARLNESPLPALDLEIDGVRHLLASKPADRALEDGGPPLLGLQALWRTLARGGDGKATLPRVELEIDRLQHPMFLWPIVAASAAIEPAPDGVRIAVARGLWAGLPIEGDARWSFEPEERVTAKLRVAARGASPPAAVAGAPEEPAGGWVSARFRAGPSQIGAWRQREAQGVLVARDAVLRLRDASFVLEPSGALEGEASLDLSRADAVPFELRFALREGDVPQLFALVGLPSELATGRVDASGSLAATLSPEAPMTPTLGGQLEIDARAGTIRRSVPAVLAIALASEMFNPFAKREQVRYERLHTRLAVEAGRFSTEQLTLEGPDVRAVASGSLEAAGAARALDVEIVLFLFRPVDSVIERIPLVDLLLLGGDSNLMAAHFQLTGPWAAPEARLVPLRTLASGPASIVFEGLPSLVRRGIEALGPIFSRGREPAPPATLPKES